MRDHLANGRVSEALAALRKKFTASASLDSEDLPPPYDEAPDVARKAPLLDEEESEDEQVGEDDRGMARGK